MEGSDDTVKRGKLTQIEKDFADFVDTNDTSEMIDKGELVEAKDVKINTPKGEDF